MVWTKAEERIEESPIDGHLCISRLQYVRTLLGRTGVQLSILKVFHDQAPIQPHRPDGHYRVDGVTADSAPGSGKATRQRQSLARTRRPLDRIDSRRPAPLESCGT